MSLLDWLCRHETRLFLTISLGFYCLGSVIGSIGPVLLEISRRTNVPVSDTGLLVTVRGLSYAIGSAIGGPLFDKYDANRILAISMTVTALGTLAISFLYNIWGIGALVLTQGLGMGLLDTGGNVCVLWLYRGENAEPYLQATHFMFAVGGLVAPLVVGGVMDAFKNNFDIAFYVIAACFTPVIISLALLDSPTIRAEKTPQGQIISWKEKILGSFTNDEKKIISLAGLFLGIYVGAEVSMGTLIYTYAVERGLSEQTAYLLNSVFWALIAAGRLLAIPLSANLKPHVMLLVNIIGCILSSTLMVIFDISVLKIADNQTLITLWIAVPAYGLFMASCFPTVFTMAEGMMNVTGKAASFFVVGSSLGEMAIPAVAAALFATSIGFFSLVVTCLICSVLMLLVWVGFLLQRNSMQKRGKLINRKKMVTVPEQEHDADEEALLVRRR